MQIAAWQAQMATEARANACGNIPRLLDIYVPIEPIIFNYVSTLSSFYKNEIYHQGQRVIIQTIKAYKNKLNNAQLKGLKLNKFSIQKSNFSFADLRKSEFIKSKFQESTFAHANLSESKFAYCNFSETDFSNADLANSSFKDSY